MKRKRPTTVRTDLEAQGSSEKAALFEGASSAQSPPRKKVRARKAIPRRMQHMKNNMTVWGDRWLPAIQPSTAGSQQGEIDPSGMYTASSSPPPSYRTTPLSPVVVSSSPNPNPLSSDFKDDSAPPRPNTPPFEKLFLFGDAFGSNFADSIGKFDNSDTDPAYDPYPEGCPFDFDAANARLVERAVEGFSFPPRPYPFPTPMAPIQFHSGIPTTNVPSDFINFHVTYPPVPGANTFSDWIPPTAQPGLPLANVALFPDGLPYNASLPYSSQSQNISTFPTVSNVPYHDQVGCMMPMVAGYSTPPMYTGHGSPYLAMSEGQYSPVYHRSGSGSPTTMYSAGQLPQYYPPAPPSPFPTRTTSSGSIASMYNNSPHAMSGQLLQYYPGTPLSPLSSNITLSGSVASMYNNSPHAMSGSSEYSDFDYPYSSPHSSGFTSSPVSVSSSYSGLEGAYPGTASSASRTIPLPFHNPQPASWLL
ncbi:hypothetical protein B0H17DRAFT_1218356 [Mycena rosella]|uniref:Uncharacterized protein n=1 Tax=Mycena rosella TaxID=1033263 RepID=A0AAD7FM28_MYCRO|nr:hypothetical protein B0H17DRAFT_1218356 [Mycena rosella]